ncbi:MAG: MFS transporter [Chloroflexi bacterium]|nr:MFS transporter [Chloroflexota bacterium]
MATLEERAPARAVDATPWGRAPLWAVFSGPYIWTSVTVLSSTIIGSMDSYIVNTSMPRVLGDLGEPQFYAWVASAFILAQIVGLSVGGAWKDRAGLRTPFLVAVAGFGLGSLLCAVAPSMPLLVFARAFQGLAGGALSALSFAAAAAYPEAIRLRMLSLISGVWGVVALGAPLLGGFITDLLGWRWIFLVNLPVCAAVILLGWLALETSKPSDSRRALPVTRAVLLAVAVAGLTAAPSASPEIAVALLAVGLVAAIAFAYAERGAVIPVIPRDTWLGRGPVGSSLLATVFYTGAYTGAGVFLPLYLVQVRGESTTQAGLVLSVGGFMWTAGSIFASTRTGHWPIRLAWLGALMIVIAGVFIAAQSILGNLPLPLIYVTWAAAGCGVGLAMLHLTNWALVYSPAAQSGVISAATQTMRMLGSAAGGALMGAVLNAIGSDPDHLRLSIAAIFSLAALIALVPATIGRPKVWARVAPA